MKQSLALRLLRDVTAVLVVGIFMFPLLWWGLTSFKPTSAIFNKDEVVFFDFEPTLVNYQVVLMGKSRAELAIQSGSTFGVGGASSYDSRQTIIDSIVVAIGSTILTVFAGVSAAYALSRMRFRGRQAYLNWILSQRFVPPIAIIVPVVFMFHYMGLRDTLIGSADEVVLRRRPGGDRRGRHARWRHPLPDLPEGGAADGDRRGRGHRRAVFRIFLDRISAFAVSHQLDTNAASEDFDFRDVHRIGMGLHLGTWHVRHRAELHLHPAGAEATRAWTDPRVTEGMTTERA
jgi:hypothetical protein